MKRQRTPWEEGASLRRQQRILNLLWCVLFAAMFALCAYAFFAQP